MRGVNRGMQIRRSVPIFSPNPSIRQNFCSNPKPQPHPKTEVQRFKGKLVHMNTTVNFAKIAQYNSSNSLTPELKWTSFEKRNNLDELMNIPIKAEERFAIQISFKAQGPNIYKTRTIRNPLQKLQPIHDPLCFQNPQIRSIYSTNPQSVRVLRPNPSIRKPIHPPLGR